MELPPNANLSLIPLDAPPPGEVPNFVDPESSSPTGRLAIYITLPLLTIAVVLRAYVRLKKRQVGVDDWFLLLGAASAASFSGSFLMFMAVTHGISPFLRFYSITSGPLYNASATFTKISILAFYLRIFSVSPLARSLIWTGIIVIPLGYLAVTGATLAYLLPRPGDGGWASWPSLLRQEKYAGEINFSQGVFSTVSDFYVVAIPMAIVSRLHLPMHKKIGLGCIFLINLWVAVLLAPCFDTMLWCLLTLGLPSGFKHCGKISLLRHPGPFFHLMFIDSVAELNIGIFCACVPVFFVLLKTWKARAESGFVYFRQRLSSGSGSKGVDTGNHDDYPLPALPSHQITQQIPSGTLTRLKTIFHRVGRDTKQSFKNSKLATDASQRSQFVELQSFDYDYHAQIRGFSPSGSERSLIAGRGVRTRC
ncbi:hypothetical protein BJX61DRAFT_540213 [Aspergillus egyptiacus]|nr:hypothetical protein BJX61DRAFT_540213 [Aspergillus egyptiacus]